MKKIKMEYNFLVFMYAYLIQIDLSLDRSRWTSWKELREYYKLGIRPARVANYLLSYSQLKNAQPGIFFVKKVSMLERTLFGFFRILLNEIYLSDREILYSTELLFKFDKYLDSEGEIHKLEVEKLRLDVSEFAYNVVRYKINIEDRKKAVRIEHFLQNEILKVVKIEEFSKGLEL